MALSRLAIPAKTRLEDAAMLPPSEFNPADFGLVQPQVRRHLPP